jgi:hypothetical protein
MDAAKSLRNELEAIQSAKPDLSNVLPAGADIMCRFISFDLAGGLGEQVPAAIQM